MKQIIKPGDLEESVRKTFECDACGCIFTSDTGIHSCEHWTGDIILACRCPWCRSVRAFEKKE